MKNVEQIFNLIINKTSSVLLVFIMLVFATIAKADIITPTATHIGGYLPGTTSTVMVDVFFNSNSTESADFIEFRLVGPIAGLTLAHGIPSPSPYIGCGENAGDEMTATGPGWGRPGFIAGNSQCGAFEGGQSHSFGVDIVSDGNYSGSFALEVRIVGDGLGEQGASEQIVTVTIQPIVCTIICPTVAPITSPANTCGINFNVPPPTVTGMCNSTLAGASGFYPVGDNEVTYNAQDVNGNNISCTTIITVVDDEDPFVSGLMNLSYDLLAGECGYIIPQTFSITENCIDPDVTLTQNLDLGNYEAGYHCQGGPTKYLRMYDTDLEGINTELNIEDISFGVLEAFNNPFVTVNIYTLNGALDYSNMELVATAVDVLPTFQNALYTIPIMATIPSGEKFVVEIIVPGSQFSGVIMAMNQGGETNPTYIATDFCGNTQPVTADVLGFNGYSAIMMVEGFQSSYILQLSAAGSGVAIGDTAYLGTTNVDYEAIDASGNVATISFQVTVNEFTGAITSIACNDEVQISLNSETCEAIVTADQVLEGGPYACYNDYIVEITDQNDVSYGNTVSEANIGQTLTVTITGPNGNSCWGSVVVQDKAPPELDCMDIYTSCTGNLFPGSPIAERVTFLADVNNNNETISAGAANINSYDVPVFGLFKSTITKVAVRLNIAHDFVSDLNATITAPDGTTATLFVMPGTLCPQADIIVTLDDAAFNTYSDLEGACSDETPSISGMYRPMQALSIFNSKDPNGTWTITISDSKSGDGGTVVSAEIIISQTGGIVGFPTDKDVIYQTEGDNSFTVLGIDPCGPAVLSYNDMEIDQDCFSQYSTVINRTWSAVDESGNQSQSCVQTIYVYRNGLATLTFPPNYDGIQEPVLSCSQFGDSTPTPATTGQPSGDLCDNVQVFPYVDTRIDICKGSYKIIRHFQLLEWCSGEVVEHNQIIKVLDEHGPILEQISDVTISAGEIDCSAVYNIPKPEVVSDCSDEFTYELTYLAAYNNGAPPTDVPYFNENVSVSSSGNIIIKDLVYGDTWAKWKVYDECGNFTEEYFTITVNDQVNPIAVCDEFTVVSVGSDGYVDVFATTFDDGSIDNCGIDRMLVSKMTNNCAGVSSGFSDKVRFCCEEVGTSVMVAFEVTDLSGNKNTCMVEVTIQDKLPPYITKCPDDITLNCQSEYTDLEVTGNPDFVDNCEVVSVNYKDSGSIDNCGEGVILRTWTVTDKQGLKATCVQRITLEDEDPFEANDITWPSDYTATTCNTNLDPENLGVLYAYPRFNDDNCSLVATTHKDSKFEVVDGACEKILREWTVIDWCTYDENIGQTGPGYYQYVQVIKLINTEAPEILNCNTTTVDVLGNCEGLVEYTIEATDDCTAVEELSYMYQIDLFNDGIDALDLNMKGNSTTFNRKLPIGTHKVSWFVEDKCGNATTCIMTLIVRDGKKPTPYCLSSITTVVMNNNGMVDIWASDFDYGSFDNCTKTEDLKISFSSNTADISKRLTCAMIANGVEDEVQLELWVTDEAGNQEYCSISVILQDSNADVCPDTDVSDNCDCTPDTYTGWAVATCNTDYENEGAVGVLYDIRDTPSAPKGSDWASSIATVQPSNWTIDQIGQVFGIALDGDQNVYLAASDIYDTQFDSDPYGPGQIFKASPDDNFTAQPFAVLENTGGPLNGIGNIAYCNDSDMLYASNLEDGKIYRINASGDIMESYDPWTADDEIDGIVDPAEQVWAIGLNKEGNSKKLYFPRIGGGERAMYSIVLNADGSFPSVASEEQEITNIPGVGLRISDIDFNDAGTQMVFAERGTRFLTGAHDSKTLRYDISNGWSMTLKYYVGGYVTDDYPTIIVEAGENSGGGVSFGSSNVTNSEVQGCDQIVWASMNYFESGSQLLYGIQGMDVDGNNSVIAGSNPNNQTDIVLDFDGDYTSFDQKGDLGDVEVFRCGSNNQSRYEVAGRIATENGLEISNVIVSLAANLPEYPRQAITSNVGEFSFMDTPSDNAYEISGSKNNDLRNGVSTLDLVMIQRHILELQEFTSPYKVIAADINNDKKIKASDLLALRKVILGIVNEFPNSQSSWRFVSESATFNNILKPFPFIESMNLASLNTNSTNNDFIAVKIGDVNGNAVSNVDEKNNSEVRSGNIVELEYDNKRVSKGQRVSIPVFAKENASLLGYQFTMTLGSADYVGVESSQIALSESNIGVFENTITTSWSEVNGVDINTESPLFTIVLDVNDDALLSQLINISSDITSAEVYMTDGTISDIVIESRDTNITDGEFAVFQNRPNPFMESTTISFYLPKADNVELTITDVTGRVVTKSTNHFEQGAQQIIVKDSDFNASGVLYYTIKSGEYTSTKKMINVR
ncbi:MAG: T9SS type A sorting domain-containing protein [Saprospiraceae bacterium]